MANDDVRPFLSAQRHDVLRDLVVNRNALIQRRVVDTVTRGMNESIPKIDGKGGALDGTLAVVSLGDISSYVPICGAYPGPKIEHPKGKDTKEGKESKDGKEGKEGKESKDGKEGKEGKESKDSKEDKDHGDGFKLGGDEVQDPFSRFGEQVELPSEKFNAIARAFPTLLKTAMARGQVMF